MSPALQQLLATRRMGEVSFFAGRHSFAALQPQRQMRSNAQKTVAKVQTQLRPGAPRIPTS